MKVLKYEVHNVLGIRDARLDLEGRHLFVVGGRNEQGKTSALNALLIALCGKRGCEYPDVPLRDGEDEGSVVVKLSGDNDIHEPESITVERLFERRRDGSIKETLSVTDSAGERAPEPQTILNSLYYAKGFDPLAFLSLNRKGRLEAIEKLLGLDGYGFRARESELVAERKGGARRRDELESIALSINKYDDAPADEVSVSDLLKSLEESRGVNELRAVTLKRLADDKNRITKVESNISKLQGDAERLRKILADEVKEAENLPPEQDLSEIQTAIETAEETNRKVRQNEKRRVADAAAMTAYREFSDANVTIEELRSDWRDSLANADWPIDGLSLDSYGLLYNGLPFGQASRSVQIRTAVRMAMAQNPKLKLMVCQHGNDLDDVAMDELERILKESDYQMLLEVVTRSRDDEDRCSVVFEDGKLNGVTI